MADWFALDKESLTLTQKFTHAQTLKYNAQNTQAKWETATHPKMDHSQWISCFLSLSLIFRVHDSWINGYTTARVCVCLWVSLKGQTKLSRLIQTWNICLIMLTTKNVRLGERRTDIKLPITTEIWKAYKRHVNRLQTQIYIKQLFN